MRLSHCSIQRLLHRAPHQNEFLQSKCGDSSTFDHISNATISTKPYEAEHLASLQGHCMNFVQRLYKSESLGHQLEATVGDSSSMVKRL